MAWAGLSSASELAHSFRRLATPTPAERTYRIEKEAARFTPAVRLRPGGFFRFWWKWRSITPEPRNVSARTLCAVAPGLCLTKLP
jgi:hypothetical protein